MNDRAITAIENYMEECLFEPRLNWPKCTFDQQSYSRWAANEILGLIMDHPFTQVDTIVEEFMLKMDYFSCVAKDPNISIIFSIAKGTAEDIFDIV
jgi:hypothetical protein